MKIGLLNKDQRQLFVDMDPFLVLERMDLPGYFALAATETDEAGEQELPAGLMLCAKTESGLIIEWIYVQKAFRMRGIGDRLMETALTIARQNEWEYVEAYVNEEWGRELVCPGEELFLDAYGFTEKRPLPGEWLTSIRALSEQEHFKKVSEHGKIVVPLQQMTRAQAEEAYVALSALPQASMLYPPVDGKAFLDDELSFLLRSQGEVNGGLLLQCISRNQYEIVDGKVIQTKEQILYPVYLCAETIDDAKLLISAALRAAGKKYPKDTEIHVIVRTDRYRDLLQQILPDDVICCRMQRVNITKKIF